jgi:RNA polymerase-binding transcription factor DksA
VGHDFSDIRLASDDPGFAVDDPGFVSDDPGFASDDAGFVADDADLVADDRGLASDEADDLQLGPPDIDGPPDDRVPDDFDLATTDGPALLTDTAGLISTDEPGRTETAGLGADGDSDSGATEIDEALLDGIERELADVELALARLGDGTYGRCESCGLVLSDEELEVAPTGRFCRAHLPLDLS